MELPCTELLGSSSPIYDETLTECCGDEGNLNVLGSASDVNENASDDWEWMQEYGDISVVLENCPGLYEKCININDICCKHDRQSVPGPTLAELNERRALSPLIHPDMKRLHRMATETCEDKIEQFSENTRQSRPCLMELNRPIPGRFIGLSENGTGYLPQSKASENRSLRTMLFYGLNRPGALNSLILKREHNLKVMGSVASESNNEMRSEETPMKQEPLCEDESVQSEAESSPVSDLSEPEDTSLADEDCMSSGSEDNDDDSTPTKRMPGTYKRKRSEAEDWTPDPKKLLGIGKQLERLNRIINSLRPVGPVSVSSKNRTRREKNKLASRLVISCVFNRLSDENVVVVSDVI